MTKKIDTISTFGAGAAIVVALLSMAFGISPSRAEEPVGDGGNQTTQIWHRTVEIDGLTIAFREAGSPKLPTRNPI